MNEVIVDKWKAMVNDSKDAAEDFNEFLDDKAIIYANGEIARLTAENRRLVERVEKLEKAIASVREHNGGTCDAGDDCHGCQIEHICEQALNGGE